MSTQADYNGQPITEGINIWWYASEAKKLVCLNPNQSAYSSVQIRIYILEKSLATHESYKDAIELEDGNDNLSTYHIYIYIPNKLLLIVYRNFYHKEGNTHNHMDFLLIGGN